jgi:methylmalonyl-CoA mutase C-terminal domain/subunit
MSNTASTVNESSGGEVLPGGPVRMIFAKGGLDAHERGAHVVVLGLREAGFEVVYLGLRRTPEQIVQAAVQEDADVIGISSLAGGHKGFVNDVLDRVRESGADILVIVGGLIPVEDQQQLLDAGVSHIFGQGSSVNDIATQLLAATAKRRARQS